MPTLTETLVLGSRSFVIQQGQYELTADALALRCQQPLVAGCDYTFEFTLNDENGDPVPITGDSFRFCVKEKHADTQLLADIAGVVIDGPNGRFDIVVPAGTFSNTTLVTGIYSIEWTDVSAGTVCTLINGCIQILPKVCL